MKNMQYPVATVRDLIKALQKLPMEAAVFLYNSEDECDAPLQVMEICKEPIPNPECEDPEQREWFERYFPNGRSPYYCGGISAIEDFWEEEGVQPVVVLRDKSFSEWEDK